MNLKILRITLRILLILPFVPLVVSSHWVQVARLISRSSGVFGWFFPPIYSPAISLRLAASVLRCSS